MLAPPPTVTAASLQSGKYLHTSALSCLGWASLMVLKWTDFLSTIFVSTSVSNSESELPKSSLAEVMEESIGLLSPFNVHFVLVF